MVKLDNIYSTYTMSGPCTGDTLKSRYRYHTSRDDTIDYIQRPRMTSLCLVSTYGSIHSRNAGPKTTTSTQFAMPTGTRGLGVSKYMLGNVFKTTDGTLASWINEGPRVETSWAEDSPKPQVITNKERHKQRMLISIPSWADCQAGDEGPWSTWGRREKLMYGAHLVVSVWFQTTLVKPAVRRFIYHDVNQGGCMDTVPYVAGQGTWDIAAKKKKTQNSWSISNGEGFSRQ